jgi:uncharacterized protein (TIGR03435 family)
MQRLAIALFAVSAFGQTFDVATIKPSPSLESMHGRFFMGPRGGPGTPDPGRYWCEFCDAALLVSFAYDVPQYRIVNATRLPSDRYHIEATVAAGATHEQFRAMLRNLLAERFQLAAHTERREMSTYRLVVGAGGPKLKEHVDGAPPPRDDPSKPRIPGISFRQQGKTITEFARVLEGQMRAPVVDATGLTTKYDFDIAWTLTDDTDSPLPNIFGAILTLGLKLESSKGALDCVIVDHVEKPTQN